jgi:hypothetical protein
MKKLTRYMLSMLLLSLFCAGIAFASESEMAGHDMASSDKFGDLIHESMVDGYMLSYYLMDLRKQKSGNHTGHSSASPEMDGSHDMETKEMDKPHHIMVYIMDKGHKPVHKGKVGFMIKDAQGKAQKAMGMFMSKGFGVTADMKEKGVYTILTKVVLEGKTLKDNFKYEIK